MSDTETRELIQRVESKLNNLSRILTNLLTEDKDNERSQSGRGGRGESERQPVKRDRIAG